MPRALGIDIGGTKIAAGLVDLGSGAIIDRREKPTEPVRGGQVILDESFDLAKTLRADAVAIGIGIAELVDRDGNIVSNATIDWMNLPVHKRFSSLAPTRLEADVRAAARAEARFGAGCGASSFLFVTVGTGISSCLVLKGEPFLGARGLTGTFASAPNLFPLEDESLATSPPLENFSSGPAIARRAGRFSDARKVVALAGMGDAAAQRAVDTGGRALGAAIAQLVNTLDPERVVIGGGLGSAAGLFHESLKKSFYEHLWSKLLSTIAIKQAKLGPDAGIIGAALTAIS